MMLLTGISRQLIAQRTSQNTIEKNFEIPNNFMSHRFSIDLSKGNTLQVEVMDLKDIDRIKNIDSILKNVYTDMISFQDSLTDKLAAKRIDYLTDAAGRKKIRITTFKPPSSSYVLRQGEMAALKSEQDTLNIIGTLKGIENNKRLQNLSGDIRYYRLSFYVNDINDLQNTDAKIIGEKVASLNRKGPWKYDKNDGYWYKKNEDKSVFSQGRKGINPFTGIYASVTFPISIQNYKNHFVPSLGINYTLISNNGIRKKYFGLMSEYHFSFEKNNAGIFKTVLNSCATISYKQELLIERPVRYLSFHPDFSLSYFQKTRGILYDANTFRLGLGTVPLLGGNVTLQPSLYFNNFFKGVTPGLRLSVQF